MKWMHRCSSEWLEARQDYLTASDVHKLVPYTKTGRKRSITSDDYRKLIMAKKKIITYEDTLSYGPAARGHYMERQAVRWLKEACGYEVYHWDDAIIHNELHLGYSPDGLNVPQPEGKVVLSAQDEDVIDATDIIEVKSYSVERHLEALVTSKYQLEERWQIATAMAVMPQVEHATLLFFCPELEHWPTHSVIYSRDDLEREIDEVEEVNRTWVMELGNMTNGPAPVDMSEYVQAAEAECQADWEEKTDGIDPF